ncbi:MAG: tagaturonate epimerase family protein [Calditrichia bacterium]
MHNLKPSVIGLKRSFGFGDRLGLATPGHMDAVKGTPFVPVFAQQSIRELQRTRRSPDEVMNVAAAAVKSEGWEGIWGADADHLQSRDDVFLMAGHGYTLFTIDPSQYVNNEADKMKEEELERGYHDLIKNGLFEDGEIFDLYLHKNFDLSDGISIHFDDEVLLLRAVVKYGAAIGYTRKMAGWIREACASRPYEIEMSVDETDTPTSPPEHFFIGMELKRNNIELVSLAPRFVGEFEKGIDYKGDLKIFEESYKKHLAIAKYCGPYKISIHSGSDKFSIYPIIGRLSGELLHVKTAGTSYLEALRVIVRTDKKLFREIVGFCRSRYNTDKATYHVSAKLEDVPAEAEDRELEGWYLENESGREILHVTFGSVLVGGKASDGKPFKGQIMENLQKNSDLYREVLHQHLGKHIRLLMS